MKSYFGSSKRAVLIMTGIGGNESGYDNKYEKIAGRLNEKYGASVFVFATPREAWNIGDRLVEQAVGEVNAQLASQGALPCELYCFGTSAGASFLGAFTHPYPQVKKLILVNPVMQSNPHKLLSGLEKTNAAVTVVFGEFDPSRKFSFMLDSVKGNNIKTIVVPNADHFFTGADNLELFLNLPEMFFEKD